MILKNILTLFLIVSVIIVSGCVANAVSSGKIDDIKNISQNPTNYMDKDIRIEGILTQYIHLTPPTIEWDYYIVDEQGYKFPIKSSFENRDFYVGEAYQISGNVKRLEYCYCQKRYIDAIGDFVNNSDKYSLQYIQQWKCPINIFDITNKWRDIDFGAKQTSSSCNSREIKEFNCSFEYITMLGSLNGERINFSFKDEYRCNPESIETFYYIDSQSMVKL